MATIVIPHRYQPREYQLKFLRNPARFKIAVWSRRSGKSKTAFNEQVRKTQLKVGVYYYVLPTYRSAKAVIFDSLLKEHVPPEIVTKINDSELAIYYKNGSIQRIVGSEDPDKHRGINVVDVVFDEYSEEKEELWTAVFQPILRENKGTATFIFTPKGRNHSWKLIQQVRDNPEWYVSILTAEDANIFSPEELAEIKRNTPEALFRQEYFCEFTDGAGQFFRRIRDNVYKPDKVMPRIGDFQIGVDLAKYQDWTVITPFNLNTFRVYPQDRFNQVDWNLQKARIQVEFMKYDKATVCIDSTGVGDPVVEDLKRAGVKIPDTPFDHAFKFTEGSRNDLLRNLAILFEQDKIKIPDDEGLIAELESFRYELGESGKIKLKVPDGVHDDRVMSLALAVYGHRDRQARLNTDIWSPRSKKQQPNQAR